MSQSSLRLKYLYRVIDHRAGTDQSPLLAVSIHRGVVPRASITDDLPRAEDLSNYKLCDAGDIVLNRMRAFQGAIGISPMRGIVSPDYMVLRPQGDVEPRYLHHFFRSAWFVGEMTSRLRGIGGTESGSVRTPRINPEDLGEIRVFIPPLQEQRRIADFLDIETARIGQLVDKFVRLQSVLIEREKVALPLTVSGSRLREGTIATEVPWFPFMHPDAKLIPLIRLLQLQRGADLSENQRIPGEVPVITTAGIAGWHNTALAQGPGVVIGRYGSVGNVHWIDTAYWPHNTTLYVKSFNDNNPRYCYHILRSLPYEMEQARAAVPGVNRNDLHRQLVPIVPHELQSRVVKQLDDEMAQIASARLQIKRAETLLNERRQALITAAITGQIDISTASGRGIMEGITS
ncbi:restriction endonuclease subunit S [Actinoallomurus acanthiterrae]